jgi:alanine racemase
VGDWDVQRQLERFTRALEEMKTEGVDPGIVHAANSPATILYPGSHFDMVRCGIAIYGLHPSKATYGAVELKAAMSVKARASLVKRIGMGDGVSYGLTWQAAAPTEIATLPLGYADGVHRAASNEMQVLLGGKRCRQVGRVCMDQLMVEVPRGSRAARGDEVVLVGTQGSETIAMDELAEVAGTINYELACGFGLRLERVYR